jgi:hypothetical protein
MTTHLRISGSAFPNRFAACSNRARLLRRTVRAEHDTAIWPARWFRQLRLAWQRYPKERHRIYRHILFDEGSKPW